MGSLVRYFGGKYRLAPQICSLFPQHTSYVEPFGGGASVLLNKKRSRLEVYNDMDSSMVTLFRVVRDRSEDLISAIALTPFSREEHVLAYEPTDNELEIARRVLVRSHFGFGGNGIHKTTGFRGSGIRAGTLPVHVWSKLPATIAMTVDRLKDVVIENRPALQIVDQYDASGNLFYLDPPYLMSTRGRSSERYKHEMSDEDHKELLENLKALKSHVVLSGYRSSMYDEALSNWRRIEIDTFSDKALKRTEVLWCNFEDCLPLFGDGNQVALNRCDQ